MLTLSVLALVACVATLTLAVSINDDGYYDTRYNHLDIERILNNKRLVTYYGQCLTGDGPCTPQGTEFKKILPEALHTNCVRCTEKQKVTAYLVIRRLKKEYPKIWHKLQVEWDPKGDYVSTFINTMESSTTPGKFVTTSASSIATTRASSIATTSASSIAITSASSIATTSASSSTSTGANSIVTNDASLIVTTGASPIINSSSTPEINGRFGENDAPADNEITKEAPATVPLTRRIPSSVTSSSTSRAITIPSSTTTTTTTTTIRITPSITNTARPSVPPPTLVVDTNYRLSLRPTRFNQLLPRPQDIGRLTANWIGSIGDIGNKVIRTGVRIADMVFSGVQAGVQATIGIGRPLQ